MSRKDTRLADAMPAVLQPLLTDLVENPQATGQRSGSGFVRSWVGFVMDEKLQRRE